jgi:hypothetical protein
VACNADSRDAKAILQAVITKGWYERSVHGPKLADHIRISQAGLKFCSRSFESFLRLVKEGSV